ncbi:MAG: biotin transporter BioY [Clostridia bacterium]|nr:biotin transporter BioY [Clostridia bacterium]
MMKSKALGHLTRISLAAALMCVVAPLALPIGPIPLTLGTFCLFLISLCFRPSDAFLTVLVYIAVGALGLPVFSGFMGGAQAFVGPTCGFLLAFPLALFLISFVGGGFGGRIVRRLCALLLGTVFLYICGAIGYLWVMNVPLDRSLLLLLLPLLLGELPKMAVSLFVFARFAPFFQKRG